MNNQQVNEAVIVAYGRSAIARAKKGALRDRHPADYGAQVLRGVLNRVPELPLEEIADIVVGCAKPEQTQGSNLGRIIAQRAGLPDSVPGQTVSRFCASGLQAIATAADTILTGRAQIVVAGGVECMTAIPMGTKQEYRSAWLEDNRPDVYLSMGITAENVASRYNVAREDMDYFALESHRKAAKARDECLFEREIIPVTGSDGDGANMIFDMDQGIRDTASLEKLKALEPCFMEGGLVTAGTSSQTSDGAAFVVLMNAQSARTLGLHPIARFVGYAVAGVPAGVMGIGPMVAIPRVLAQTGLSVEDMDVIELNEAFAAQAIPCIRELDLPTDRVNPRGGAIALGHPLGATGAILTVKALSYLEDTGGRYALISMCIGGGMGAAGIFERIVTEEA